MVGQVQPRAPPELIDDVIGQILVRIPPDESAYLAGASHVCKLWRRIITDPDFTRRYRELHRTPPVLGFLHNVAGGWLRFFPTAAACPFPQRPGFDTPDCCGAVWVRDCRHGRVLLDNLSAPNLLVRDPITGDQEEVPKPRDQFMSYNAMVLCAVAGCDHGDCHGGPFLIVLVGTRAEQAQGCVYSSVTRAWGSPASLHYLGRGARDLVNWKRAALVGDDACFILRDPAILRYNFDKNRLSTIDLPDGYCSWDVMVMSTDDGSLGLAAIRNSSNLCVWSREMNPKGVPRWVQCRVMELEKLLPINIFAKRASARVIGFAEGVGVMFVRIDDTIIFMIELKSGRVGKVSHVAQYCDVFPFMSFHNPGFASSVLSLPAEEK